ncbi:MAG: ATP-dependent helicase, partial [Acidimicrobiales bacterium]
MEAPGPAELGRGVVIGAGAQVPPPWSQCPIVRIDEAVLAEPGATVARLHQAWLARRPVVVEMAVDPTELREPEVVSIEPYRCEPGMELWRDRLQFLAWTNSYDARNPGGEPIWWHGRRAQRLGAVEGGPADVLLPDGRAAFCDGGPSEAMAEGPGGASVVHRWAIEAGSLTPLGPRPAKGSPPGADLAPDQLAAVTHWRGPARVIAPAGSGKTRVLTARLRHLLAVRGVHPGCVTAVAFNRKAVDELTGRTVDLAEAGYKPHIRTVNSLALAICNGLGGGVARPRLRVITEREVRRIIEGLVEVRPQANTDILAPYLEALSMVRIGLINPARAETAIPDAQGLPAVFRSYRQILARECLADFDEQIYLAIQILLADPTARQGTQALARHLLVDEFQDLAPAHLLLLRLVAGPTLDCFGVGDDDQCIYGYAGANPHYLISFEDYFPGARPYALEVGYRCPPAVIEAASNLLSHNRRRISKETRPAPGRAGGADDLEVRPVSATEMGPQAQTQVERWLSSGVEPGDIAVLARVNSALLGTQVALSAAGIACTRPLDSKVLERTGMRTALAYLRIALAPERIAAADINETIRRPPRRIARNVLEMVTKPARIGVSDIRRLAKRLSGGDSEKLSSFAADIGALSRAVPQGTGSVLGCIRERVGLGEAMAAL